MRPPKHCNETERLKALHSYDILDTPDEQAYDDITQIAAHICEAPIAVINFIDAKRQWFKSAVGTRGIRQTPLDNSICAYTILQPGLLVVPDTTEDIRFADNPIVTEDPRVRFYAGALLQTPQGYPLGTLCVLDVRPRDLTAEQSSALLALSRQVMSQLELRVKTREVALLNQRLHEAVYESSHRLKNHLQLLATTVDMATLGNRETIPAQEVQRLGTQILALSVIHDILTADTKLQSNPKSISSKDLLEQLLIVLKQTSLSHAVRFEITDIPLPLRIVTSLALGVNELVSNAIKYGANRIEVAFYVQSGECVLEVCDDGPGFPDNFDPLIAANTGLELLELTRRDVSGLVSYGTRGEGGAKVVLRFPLP